MGLFLECNISSRKWVICVFFYRTANWSLNKIPISSPKSLYIVYLWYISVPLMHHRCRGTLLHHRCRGTLMQHRCRGTLMHHRCRGTLMHHRCTIYNDLGEDIGNLSRLQLAVLEKTTQMTHFLELILHILKIAPCFLWQ